MPPLAARHETYGTGGQVERESRDLAIHPVEFRLKVTDVGAKDAFEGG